MQSLQIKDIQLYCSSIKYSIEDLLQDEQIGILTHLYRELCYCNCRQTTPPYGNIRIVVGITKYEFLASGQYQLWISQIHCIEIGRQSLRGRTSSALYQIQLFDHRPLPVCDHSMLYRLSETFTISEIECEVLTNSVYSMCYAQKCGGSKFRLYHLLDLHICGFILA